MEKEKLNYYYALDDMLVIFKAHSKENEERIEEARKNFPPVEGKEYDDFNICKALHSICYEIDQLKNGQNTR